MSLTSQQPTRPRVIKRYANRKLYDTRDSRYVTLLQIAEYVRGGEEVAIIDNTTKEDLTNVTLAQIVYEEERKSGREGQGDEPRRESPTVGALRTLIQQSGERLMSSLGLHGRAAEAGADKDKPAEDKDKPADPAAATSGEARRLLVSPKEAWDELQRLADDRMKSVLGTAITHVQQLQGEVKRLQGRIEELEQKLVAMSARERAPRPESEPPSEPAGGGAPPKA